MLLESLALQQLLADQILYRSYVNRFRLRAFASFYIVRVPSFRIPGDFLSFRLFRISADFPHFCESIYQNFGEFSTVLRPAIPFFRIWVVFRRSIIPSFICVIPPFFRSTVLSLLLLRSPISERSTFKVQFFFWQICNGFPLSAIHLPVRGSHVWSSLRQ